MSVSWVDLHDVTQHLTLCFMSLYNINPCKIYMCVQVKWGELRPQITCLGGDKQQKIYSWSTDRKRNKINTTYPREPVNAGETRNKGRRQMEKDRLSYFLVFKIVFSSLLHWFHVCLLFFFNISEYNKSVSFWPAWIEFALQNELILRTNRATVLSIFKVIEQLYCPC